MKMRNDPKRLHTPVASGSYRISKRKNEILDAYLGSCVGITICDKNAGVGGLAHILLPEPTGSDKPFKEEIYATTGLPIFIKALCDTGAQKDRMEATIAGGSLVGPVSRADLDLDIGGRTTEAVNLILKEEGIKLNHVETGGYFNCRLSFDLKTFQSSIQPIGNKFFHGEGRAKKIDKSEIFRAIDNVRPIPQIALKVIRMMHASEYNMNEVAREIRQDQVLSAKVIKLCNSAFFGLKKKIDSIDRALVILGERLLLQLVVSASMELYFSRADHGYSLSKGGLFQHAIGAAMVTEELAAFTAKAIPDVAYTAGLLHDIGKVVLDQYLAEDYPFFYRKIQIDGKELCDVENEKFGITHEEIGSILAKKWELPENLIDTITNHSYPERACVAPELAHLVYITELILSRFNVGQELECLNVDGLLSRLKRIGLTPSQIPSIIDVISRRIFDFTPGQTIPLAKKVV